MKALSLVAITTLLTACFDDTAIIGAPGSTQGGNETDNTTNDNNLSGQWIGAWNNSSTLLESCGTASAPFVLDVTQTGSSVSAQASLDCTGTPIENLLTGTVSGNEILLTDANNRDTFTLAIESPTTMTGTVIDITETISAEIRITR